jgi:hypothetical protein
MKQTVARLAAAASAHGPGAGLKPRPMALLPPIPLYRRLLRAHRKYLNPEQRFLGDRYIKEEFRAHRNVDNPAHLIGFLSEWQLYAQTIEGDSWSGEKIDQAKFEKLNDEQVQQLYELMQAIKGRHGDGQDSS